MWPHGKCWRLFTLDDMVTRFGLSNSSIKNGKNLIHKMGGIIQSKYVNCAHCEEVKGCGWHVNTTTKVVGRLTHTHTHTQTHTHTHTHAHTHTANHTHQHTDTQALTHRADLSRGQTVCRHWCTWSQWKILRWSRSVRSHKQHTSLCK